MTNEEVISRAREEFALRGLSSYTEEEYLGALRLFLRYYENRSLETMGKPRFGSSCCTKSISERQMEA